MHSQRQLSKRKTTRQVQNAQEQVDQDIGKVRQDPVAKADEKNPTKNHDTDKGRGKSAPKKCPPDAKSYASEKGFPDRKWRETIVM
jgi:hypothetical protein